MNYKKISIPVAESQSEIFVALLSDMGYEGFETTETQLFAYIKEPDFNQMALQELLKTQHATAEVVSLEAKNWNEEWERNFPPVTVEGFCTVRADFHQPESTTPYEIVINPKMSFGTGHHATTQLMMEAMKDLDFEGKKVLDFGTGTGILAILSAKLGAAAIVAVDNEEWACENTQENAHRNNVNLIDIYFGSLEQVPETGFDIVLANINRHILLHYMPQLFDAAGKGGFTLLSGILLEDQELITTAAKNAGFEVKDIQLRNNWLMVKLYKAL